MKILPLAGRKAMCTPNCPMPASNPDLAFFKYQGPDSPAATEYCKHCRMHERAHHHQPQNVQPASVIETGRCQGFEPVGDVGYDSYYCGCRGWD